MLKTYTPIWKQKRDRENDIKSMRVTVFDMAVEMLRYDKVLAKYLGNLLSIGSPDGIDSKSTDKISYIDDHGANTLPDHLKKRETTNLVITRYERVDDNDLTIEIMKRSSSDANQQHENAWVSRYGACGNALYTDDGKVHLSTWSTGQHHNQVTASIAKINLMKHFKSPPVTWIARAYGFSDENVIQRFVALLFLI